MNAKTCTKCGLTLPLSEFHKHRITKDGLAHVCRKCSNKRSKEFSFTPSGIFTNVKGRNKYYQHKPFKITREYFIGWYENTPKICVYCDLTEEDLPKIDDSYNNKSLRLSIDSVDNELGYIEGNLAICCHRCNSLKSDILTYDEMREFGQKYIKPKWERQLGRKI